MNSIEFLINEIGEPTDSWKEQEEQAVQSILYRIEAYPEGHIPAEVRIKNIGRGADWTVVSLALLSTATGLFFTIPAAHKKVRESIKEWKIIYNNYSRLIQWMAFSSPIYYPEHYLFLVALLKLDEETEASELIYLGSHTIPVPNPSLQGIESRIFNFLDGSVLESVAVSRQGEILWHNSTELGSETA